MKKKKKYYAVVNDELKENSKYIEGAFPFTEEGKMNAEQYAKKLSKNGVKYKVTLR